LGERGPTLKQLIRQREAARKRIKEKMEAGNEDDAVFFEELGVDQMFVDESHEFKNLAFPTKMTRIAGLNGSDSARANDMFIKTGYIQKMNNGKGIVFASGTPISNTMAEMTRS
jgi:N12 class adenine-specific DNA methylase